jgi:diguanylate cyclase (GGDEF)-like protein
VSAAASTSEIGDHILPIADTDPHVLRARRTAAWTRAALGAMGIALIFADRTLLIHPSFAIAGFAVILVSSVIQLSARRLSWIRTEESLAGIAGLLIVGMQSERVNVIGIVWLAAVASGVLARGGRVHWIGRTVVLSALALPILRTGHLSLEYAALFGATVGLLLTSGRLTRELNHLLHQARYDADHDDLTGLLSYAAFRAVLEQTVEGSERSAPVSLLLLDLERFGIVNKTHGHAAGDALLAAVGERLLLVAGAEHTVGRLGGDEFAVLCGGASREVAAEIAERVRQAVRAPVEVAGQTITVDVTIGIAYTGGTITDHVVERADRALRNGKAAGRSVIRHAAD